MVKLPHHARVFSQKSFHIARGDWSVAGGEEEPYGWQDLRFEVHDGKCIPKYVCETIRPNINTQVSWLRALAGASNIIECSDAQALQAAGDPAIFWALIALSIERGEQPLQLIEVVNRKDWRRPPEEGHAWRIVIAEIYCDPGTPIPEGYGFPDV
ncbi:hypothetical protein C7212DRAFT_357695 [Tuber magnatum]|uniref:Uncharacterized protein n=1 Tax=Tuber magnatum TaxID=42249 RepID=A0A317SQ41_9PEZI|nr:hypothetical protein C7212DRAFT_357695 [Tuber magnatum]